jgi:hypothetical protein
MARKDAALLAARQRATAVRKLTRVVAERRRLNNLEAPGDAVTPAPPAGDPTAKKPRRKTA